MGTCTCTLQLAVRSTVHVTTYAKTFYPFTNATFRHSAVTYNHLRVACYKIFFISGGSQENLKTLRSRRCFTPSSGILGKVFN